jgi:nucleoside-diphosphate-sugar epimerase
MELSRSEPLLRSTPATVRQSLLSGIAALGALRGRPVRLDAGRGRRRDRCHRTLSHLVLGVMRSSLLLAVASDTWVAVVVSTALCVLIIGPPLLLCLYAAWQRGPDANARAVDDVERFVELTNRARAELKATGSFDRFIVLKDEARRHIWPSPAERARRRRQADEVTGTTVSQAVSEVSRPVPVQRWTNRRRRKGEVMRVFVAGAAGSIGRCLVPQLVTAGYQVVATTRSAEKLELLRRLGAEPVLMNGLDAFEVGESVARAEPDVIVHQMTALARMSDLRHFDRGFAVTNELRKRGTDYLLAAGEAAGVRRFIAQSYTGWSNTRTGGPVKNEQDPLDPHPPAEQSQTLAAIHYLEQAVLKAPFAGIVLRYGNFYGPGASEQMLELLRKRKMPIVGSGAGIWSWVHIEDAASATVAAIEHGEPGVYNIVDDDPAPLAHWLPYLADAVGAKPPRHIPVWLGTLAAGEVGVSMMTQIRGASNAKAKRELHWQPTRASWRTGFHELRLDGLTQPRKALQEQSAA